MSQAFGKAVIEISQETKVKKNLCKLVSVYLTTRTWLILLAKDVIVEELGKRSARRGRGVRVEELGKRSARRGRGGRTEHGGRGGRTEGHSGGGKSQEHGQHTTNIQMIFEIHVPPGTQASMPDTPAEEDGNPLRKLQPQIDHRCFKLYQPQKEVSINERMVESKARYHFRQDNSIPGKRPGSCYGQSNGKRPGTLRLAQYGKRPPT